MFAKAGAEAENLEKLKAFADTSDGFELAELDLRMRGPGNLLGTQQTGIPPFRIADIVRDQPLLELARTAAIEIMAADPELADPKYGRLKQQVLARHGGMIEFGDVG